MSKTIANFKCKLCGDTFTAQPDKFYTCKCGKSKVKPEWGGTQYDPNIGFNCERLHDGNDHTYYDENDIYIMAGEILNLFNEVKSLCTELDFHIYENFEQDENGNEYLSYINYTQGNCINNNFDEQNEIEFCVNFKNYFNEDKYKNRLITFKKYLLMLKNQEINIRDRKSMISMSDTLNIEWDREQLKKYDYTFYF